ncbi:MAG: GNAT family N-acetyltransferase [Chloroflexia bacterium]
MTTNNLNLARMQAAALFVHDEGERLLCVNEPDPSEPAPRFFLARTSAGNLWRTRCDLPAGLATELERLAAGEPVTGDLQGPAYHMAEYTALLGQHQPVTHVEAGPAYYLPELEPPSGAVTITTANLSLVEAYYPYTRSMYAELAPVVACIADGVAVAVCFSARITAQVAEAGVHTVEAYRGRGYGAETVRGWATELRAMGRLPLYSTSWENAASRAVARKLGAVQYAVDLSIE